MLRVENISKRYDNAPLLRDVSFDVAGDEILCLLGPSGAGKTTLLRIIAGLEEADAGRIVFDGKDLAGVPPHERGFGLMFQDLALFPHKNVFDNVAFGLRMQHLSADDIRARVNEALELVGLDAARFAARDVNQLSGGEQQRVALARTLAPRPRLVMFDEPLGALDRILREELVIELRTLLKRLGMMALYVTHDQDEAFAIADRLAILNAGRIEQSGTPVEIFRRPANAFVARFLGLTNLVAISELALTDFGARADTAAGTFVIERERATTASKEVLLRPGAVERIVEQSARTENVLRGRIVETVVRGGHQWVVVETRAGRLAFEWDGPVTRGAEVALELAREQIAFVKR
jgi:ABC-type Fe3+/spermidine/putrescine transport system ATPase subunit